MCILQTERLDLRPPRPWDIQDLAVWLGDYDVAKMTARVPHPYTEEHAEEFLAAAPDGRHVFVIERRADRRFLGAIGLRPEADGHAMGYWLAKPYWGQGYATEAARRMLAYAFEHLRLESLRAGFFADNPASGHVLAKLGGRHSGSKMLLCVARDQEVLCHDMLLTRASFLRKQGSVGQQKWEPAQQASGFASGGATNKKAG